MAQSQSIATDPDQPYTGTLVATDSNGDVLTYSIATNPTSGTVTTSGTGNRDFQYIPNNAFVGSDNFTFLANDGAVNSNTATISVEVNTKPSVVVQSYTTSDIAPLAGTFVANDAESDAVTFSIASAPTRGMLTILDPATGDFSYVPNAAADGMDSFAIIASDAFQSSVPETINVEIFGWAGNDAIWWGS